MKKMLVINPLVIFVAGWALWWLIFISSSFQTDVDYYLEHEAFDLYRNSLLSLGFGIITALVFFSSRKKTTQNSIIEFDFNKNKNVIYAILVFSLFVDFLQSVDFISATHDAVNLTQAREDLRSTDSIFPAQISYTIFVLFKVSIFPIFLVLLIGIDKVKKSDSFILYMSFIVALYPLVNLLVFGKRAFMIVTLGIYIFYFIYFRLWRVKGLMVIAFFLFLFLFSISYITFNARYGGEDFALLYSIQAGYSYAATVLPTPEVISSIEDNIYKYNNFLANLQISLINFAQYYTHGVFEFFDLYDFNQGAPRTNGTQTLSMPYKILDIFGILDLEEITVDSSIIDPKNWIFDSFLGGQLKDWGENAVYSMFIIGMVFGLSYRLAQRNEFLFPLYAYISTVVFFMPVTDIMYNAQGWHYIVLCIFFYLYAKMTLTGSTKKAISIRAKHENSY